jgi:hypothetical protein
VQKQLHVSVCELCCDGPANAATRPGYQITFQCNLAIVPDCQPGFQPPVAGKMPARHVRQDA